MGLLIAAKYDPVRAALELLQAYRQRVTRFQAQVLPIGFMEVLSMQGEPFSSNRKFLADLFAGPFRGHGFIISAPGRDTRGELGDYAVSDRPVREWVPLYVKAYETDLAYHEALGDDCVPYVNMNTNTGVFANAFGCRFHVYGSKYDTNACALPCVGSAEEADALPEPSLDAPAISRFFELAHLLRRELGPEAPISVPDIQSPFDIAALVWKKEDLLADLLENPGAVHRLVGKCQRLLKRFFDKFFNELGEVNLCHCPEAWAPKELGIWLSEDEAGAISPQAFGEFCLPSLIDLSETYGGLFIHCCAEADHQYGGFRKIPNLLGFNRVWTSKGPGPAIEEFSGRTALIPAWLGEDGVNRLLDMALPETRFLFNLSPLPLEEAKDVLERLRLRSPRIG